MATPDTRDELWTLMDAAEHVAMELEGQARSHPDASRATRVYWSQLAITLREGIWHETVGAEELDDEGS